MKPTTCADDANPNEKYTKVLNLAAVPSVNL